MMDADNNTVTERLERRNREVGHMLAQAREQQQRSVRTCAAVLGTSRRRYSAIERGETGITIGELELLADFLSLSLTDLVRGTQIAQEDERLVVRVRPGDHVQVEFVA